MLRYLKILYLALYRQLRVRKNLYQIRDSRALSLFCSANFLKSAELWPEVLPWSPGTILDVGAHHGEIAEQLSMLYHPSFIGMVEPLPQCADILKRKNLSPRQLVFECALGRTDAIADLNVLSNLASSSILQVNPDSEAAFNARMDHLNKIAVKVRTLDDVFSECKLDVLDLLKIDVQGYELEVFAGGLRTLQSTRLIVSEVSFFEHYYGQPMFKDIYGFLHHQGFELRNMFGYVYNAHGSLLQCDAVFINKLLKLTPG